jgi:hypothetical protein
MATRDTAMDKKAVTLNQVVLDGEAYFQITDSNLMRTFFMSIVSASNHWMFDLFQFLTF